MLQTALAEPRVGERCRRQRQLQHHL
jgi:hypothetical protein